METASQIYKSIIKKQNILKMLRCLNLAAFLWPPQAVVKDNYSCDFVIIGGGTAGCIIASNLARQKMKVLLIEAGAEPTLETELPGLYVYLADTDFDWNFTSVRNETTRGYHKGEVTHLQQGKVLGGSAQVSLMLYGIGHPQDYQEWVDITNDPSWSYKELCPLIKRSEKVIDPQILNSPDVCFRGTKGKLQIKKYYSKLNDGYFESFNELGYKYLNDFNPNNTIGFTNIYTTIGNRVRQSTAYGFLSPEKDNPYLKVMYNSLVTKIIFNDEKRAVGVQILTKDKTIITVKANKEVIVTAGTIKTAHLLMLSGIGPKADLEEKGIEVIEDLPVGQNFQDHPTCIVLHKMGEALALPPPNPHELPKAIMEGRLSVCKCKSRPDYQILSAVISDSRYFMEICGTLLKFKNELCDRLLKKMYNRQVNFIALNLFNSDSRGEVRLNSTNPEDSPIIDPGYYSNGKDLERHAEYLDHFHTIVNTKFYKSVKAEFVDPELESNDGLEIGSFEYWKNYALGMGATLHNYVGTCAMGSVVDSKLRVKGVKGLRVADASVMPKIIGSTVKGTVMIIAQKLTDLLVKDYNICSP